ASNAVAFSVPPAIASVLPTVGPIGTVVTIAGSNFGASQETSVGRSAGRSAVSFNGAVASPQTWSVSSITVPVPAAASTGPVLVTVGGGAGNAVPFAVPPVITAVSPASSLVGGTVAILGSNFGALSSGGIVTFEGVTAGVASWSETRIDAVVPAGASSGDVVV